MSINIGPPAVEELRPRITVIGVGGAGGNAIANMIRAEIEGVDFIVANTDAQALNSSIASTRIQLGPHITQGLGAGSRPEVGRAAAEETIAEIEAMLDGVHMCFIAAGMGGGTGTGAAPVIAKMARDRGVLTVGVVTKPFLFEGTRRMRSAEAGIAELQKHVDTLIVIPNQNLFLVAKAETTFKEAFLLADEVLQQGVRSITDLMVMPGLINLDFADVRSVMAEMGKAMMGTGEGEGQNRARDAAEKAIANPLLDGVSMQGAKGVIISIIGGEDMRLMEVDEAANHIRELVDPNANIIWGSAFNPDLEGRIRVSVVATGIEQVASSAEDTARPFNMGAARGPARPAAAPASGPATPAPGYAAPAPGFAPQAPGYAAPSVPETLATPAPSILPPAAPIAAAPGHDEEDPFPSPAAFAARAQAAAYAPQPAPVPRPYLGEQAEPFPAPPQQGGPQVSYGFTPPPAYGAPPAEPLDLGAGHEVPGQGPADRAAQDELLLDVSRLIEEDGHVPSAHGAAPGQGRTRGLASFTQNDGAQGGYGADPRGGMGAAPVPPVAGQGAAPAGGSGGTLFERMANLTHRRRAAEVDEPESEDGPSINIPRFLGRQNNQ